MSILFIPLKAVLKHVLQLFSMDLSSHKPGTGTATPDSSDGIEGDGVTRRLTEISVVSGKVVRTSTQEGPDEDSSRMVV